MPIIYATHDRSGFAGSGTGAANWTNLHDGASAKNAYFAQEDGTEGVRAAYVTATNAIHLYRAFFEFSIPSDAPSNISSLTLNIKGKGSNNNSDVIVVKGNKKQHTKVYSKIGLYLPLYSSRFFFFKFKRFKLLTFTWS